MGCFEVGGQMAAGIVRRITATETRVSATPASAINDFFAPASAGYAREVPDFVAGLNQHSKLSLSQRKTARVAEALGSDAKYLEQYGQMHRSLNEMRERLKFTLPNSPTAEALKWQITHAERTVASVNQALAASGNGVRLNLQSVNEAMELSLATRDPAALAMVGRAMREFSTAASKAKDSDGAVKLWEETLKRNRPHLSQADIDQAKACMFTTGAR
jgi:hypothetical protein